MFILNSLIVILATIIFLYLFYFLFTIPLFFAPYVSTRNQRMKEIFELAEAKPGNVFYDFGSGDGRITIEAAKNYGLKAIGIEINPFLVYLSRKRIKKLGLEEKATIYWGNFFKKNISDADIIFTYLTQMINNRLEKKFLSELKSKTKIISLAFAFKKIPLIKSKSNIRLYQIP